MKDKKRTLTSPMLQKSSVCIPIDDLVYLPFIPNWDTLCSVLGQMRKSGLLKEVLPNFLPQDYDPFWTVIALENIEAEYQRSILVNSSLDEPTWICRIPSPLKQYLRSRLALSDWGYDPLFIPMAIPFTGINYFIVDEGLTKEIFGVFPRLHRLSWIKQLGYLQDPVVSDVSVHGYPLDFPHTRLAHVLDVLALITLVLYNNDIPSSLSHIAKIAALCHDALTPAGGDTIKLVDPQAFDEDVHFAEFLKNPQWEKYRKEKDISEKDLVATVQGKAVLGTILDICDKIAYVSRDVAMYQGRYSPSGPIAYPQSYEEIHQLLVSHPYITSIWDVVKIIDGDVVIVDAKRLYYFLKLRALLFQELYYHPGSRFKEFMISHVIVKYLYDNGEITRDQLLEMGDIQLGCYVDEKLGCNNVFALLDSTDDVRVETFSTIDGAKKREKDLLSRGTLITLCENLSNTIKPEMHYLVPTSVGCFKPFFEAYPEFAEDIQRTASIQHPVRLYYYASCELPFNKEFLKAFSVYRARSIQ